eukprot:CAMPEP_0117507580 /NCGR_PEP_ID=MMETSP0784-20121206/26495_1 /TAXON_ID=39447 /ORGANISM="" /LENGTH=113 /DNA_ID=CAMNT_0005303085 /DNA_START=944 /DNA_END=1282 /DNA_ORIENTATION=+
MVTLSKHAIHEWEARPASDVLENLTCNLRVHHMPLVAEDEVLGVGAIHMAGIAPPSRGKCPRLPSALHDLDADWQAFFDVGVFVMSVPSAPPYTHSTPRRFVNHTKAFACKLE